MARFELRERIGEGGMGEVHRAFDRTTGAFVAVKTMTARSKVDAAELQRQQRFLQEAELLAQVRHPNVVRHVAHGVDDAGRPFLAMEWLSGVDLDRALENGPLTIADTIAVLHGTAAGLAELHRRGIVHRDVKPANVFLEDGDSGRVKLLDLGVAHLQGGARHTRTGALVGTPGYMAPEQARGQAQLTPAADLFSLGALVYECLAGRPAFQSENIPALLAKILFDTPPPVTTIRGDVPPALAELVEQLLAKDPTKRPKDACELLELLPQLPTSAADAPRLSSTQPIGDAERRLTICVFSRAVGPVSATFDAPRTGELPPLDEETSVLARRYGAQLAALADGSAVFVFADAGKVPTEQVRYAVGFARELHRARRRRAVAVATAFLAVPLGATESAVAPEAIEKAARLLAFLPDGTDGAPLVLDDLTTNLLDEGTARDGDASAGLQVEAPEADLPFVGRQRELAVLRGTFEEVADEQVARTVVVHGVAGIGKTRLVQEFLEGVRKSGDGTKIFQVEADPFAPHVPLSLAARFVAVFSGILATDGGDARQRKLLELTGETSVDHAPIAAAFGAVCGVPFPEARGWANDAIREKYRDALVAFLDARRGEGGRRGEIAPAVIVLEGIADDASRKLFSYLTKTLPDVPTLVIYVERDEGDGPRSPRRDEGAILPVPLGPLPPKALERLAAELGGDALTAKDRADAVQESEGNPLLLQELLREQVAVGRRDSWTVSGGAEVLHATASGAPSSRLSEFPGGRNLGANGRLLAFVTARFQRFDPPARRLLRAASVFGGVAPAAGVRVLTGDDVEGFAERVGRLVAAGVLRVVDDTLRIVQSTLRDAAYASFPREDRQLAHALAAGFLAREFEARTPGASDRRTDFRGGEAAIAAHWERGARADRAALWWVRAARSALFAADPDAAERFVAAALKQIPVVVDESVDLAPKTGPSAPSRSTDGGGAVSAGGERVTSEQKNLARAEALVLAAQISAYRGEERERLDRAMDALLAAPRRSDAWFSAAAELSEASYSCADPVSLHPVAVAVRRGDFDAAESPASLDALLQVSDVLFRFGRAANATSLLVHAEVRAPDDPHGRLRFAMRAVGARSERARAERDVVATIAAFDEGLAAAVAVGDRRSAMQFRIRRAEALAGFGRLEEADRELLACREEAKALNDRGHAVWGSLVHGVVLHELAESSEERERATALFEHGANVFAGFGNRGGAALAWSLRARACWFAGDPVEALRCARKARPFTDEGGATRRTTDALVLLGLVATGSGPEAHRLARRLGFLGGDVEPRTAGDDAPRDAGDEAPRRPSSGPISDRNIPLSRLAEAEVLAANGREAAAREVLRAELARIDAAAARIPDEPFRALYLGRVPEHVALRALARRLEPKDESTA